MQITLIIKETSTERERQCSIFNTKAPLFQQVVAMGKCGIELPDCPFFQNNQNSVFIGVNLSRK